jgi:hypothetical protein
MLKRLRTDIPTAHYAALLAVKEDLADKSIKFAMNRWESCICGGMERHLGENIGWPDRFKTYENLFMPGIFTMIFSTRAKAARAIDRFLEGKEYPWARN